MVTHQKEKKFITCSTVTGHLFDTSLKVNKIIGITSADSSKYMS